MPSDALTVLAWVYVLVAFGCALVIVFDVLVRGHRQMMPVMEWVWPITALYLGPVGLWGYMRHGRQYSMAYQSARGADSRDVPDWMRTAISTIHCGAGCTLGDIIAETLVFAFALTLFGQAIFASFGLDYLFAFSLGVVFQFFALRQMGIRDPRELAKRTVRADLYPLTAFEVGLFAWMGLTWFVFFPDPHLQADSVVFWFMMQVGMVIGFLTSYPANVWLIRRGVKEAM